MPDMARFDPFSPTFDHPLLNSSPDYGSRTTPFRNRVVGEIGPVNPQSSFRERNKRLQSLEDERNQLIDDLLYQLEITQNHVDRLQLDYNREVDFNRQARQEDSSLRDQLSQVKTIMDRNAFILVLIDADSLLFNKDLLSKGEKGGVEAANKIINAAQKFCTQTLHHLESFRVVVRIYANVKSLADHLTKLKVIERSSLLDDFVRGANGAEVLLDFVDSGSRPNATREKISEQFQSNIYDCHCHQIILGCDNKYAPTLEETIRDPTVLNHITLLEAVPFEKEIATLKEQIKSTKFDGLFRTTKLAAVPAVPKGPLQAVTASLPALSRVESNGTTGTTSSSSTPAMTWASISAQPFLPSGPPSKASTTRTSTPTSMKSPDVVEVKPAGKSIERNRFDQRIDKVDSSIPNHEIQRIKKLKLCNIFYLQGPTYCTSNNCSHSHTYPLSKGERSILREVARMTPCYYRMDCSDPECIYGHRCPQNKTEDPGCWYGEDCRFYGWGHGIDTRVVKTVKV